MADRRYETLVLVHPEQGETGAKDVTSRIRSLIEAQGGAISQVLEWGMRDLAFLVEKQRRAIYVLFEYRIGVVGLREVERNVRLMDAVLRFLSVQQAENAPPATLRHQRTAEPEAGEGDEAMLEAVDGEGA